MGLKKQNQEGFVFLEVLIGSALIIIVITTLVTIGFSVINLSHTLQKTAEANALIKEEIEAVRSFRDGTTWASSIGNLSTGSANPYHMVLDNSTNPGRWTIQTGAETTGIYTRKVVFDSVSRDPTTNNIETTYNSAHRDGNTLKVTVTVSWSSSTSQVVAYLTNWQK